MDSSDQEVQVETPESGDRSQDVDALRTAVREGLGEFIESQKRTASLEKRVNELIAENQEARKSAEVRTELQRMGVTKVELAYKAVRDEVARLGGAELRSYLTNFVSENPELLPARMAGGSGASA